MNFFIPRLIAFVFCLIAFGIGIYFQREERKRRELRRRQMTTITGTVGSARQALYPTWENPGGLGRMQQQQEQQGQPRFKN